VVVKKEEKWLCVRKEKEAAEDDSLLAGKGATEDRTMQYRRVWSWEKESGLEQEKERETDLAGERRNIGDRSWKLEGEKRNSEVRDGERRLLSSYC
jgi:hypothetical protein